MLNTSTSAKLKIAECRLKESSMLALWNHSIFLDNEIPTSKHTSMWHSLNHNLCWKNCIGYNFECDLLIRHDLRDFFFLDMSGYLWRQVNTFRKFYKENIVMFWRALQCGIVLIRHLIFFYAYSDIFFSVSENCIEAK